jgi:hypothetical protein
LHLWRKALGKKPNAAIKVDRLCKYKANIDTAIEKFMRRHKEGSTSQRVKRHLNVTFEMDISRSTVFKKLKQSDTLESNTACLKRKVKSAIHRRNRVQWAKTHIDSQFDTVFFTDEKQYMLDGQYEGKLFYHKANGRPTRERFIKRKGVHCCMCLNVDTNECSLHILRQHFKAVDYGAIMKDFIPYDSRVVHDRASIHKGPLVRAVFAIKGIRDMELPSKSPDLNVVENAWSMLSLLVYRNKEAYDSKDDLERGLVRAWRQLEQRPEYFFALVESMRRRCKAVIEAKGYPTKY